MSEHKTWLDHLANRFYAIPTVAQLWARRVARSSVQEGQGEAAIPFVRLRGPLNRARGALITTGGVHLRTQQPFDMVSADGDPTYREIPADSLAEQLTITHKYYDHRDADADLNVIFPLAHLRSLVEQGVVGALAPRHFGFMGHVDGEQVATLVGQTARAVAAKLRQDGVDFVLLTPA